MGETVFTPCLEGIKLVKSEEGEMLTRPFLDISKLILPILDRFGPAMTIVKCDISANISRLEKKYNSNPTRFKYLYNLVQSEVETKTAKSSHSCTNGLLWLTRAVDFLVELFHNLAEHEEWSMQHVYHESYNRSLKKWHGWITNSGFMMGIKLAPDRKKFMELLGSQAEVNEDMLKFREEFSPVLADIHKFLQSVGLDNLKSP